MLFYVGTYPLVAILPQSDRKRQLLSREHSLLDEASAAKSALWIERLDEWKKKLGASRHPGKRVNLCSAQSRYILHFGMFLQSRGRLRDVRQQRVQTMQAIRQLV